MVLQLIVFAVLGESCLNLEQNNYIRQPKYEYKDKQQTLYESNLNSRTAYIVTVWLLRY